MTSRPASADGGTRPMLGAPLPKGMLSPGSARQLAAIPDPKSSAHQDAAFATSSTALLPRAVSGGASIARLPDWATDRPYSGSTHLINTLQNRDRVPKGTVSRKQGLNTYPVPMQEQLIADDLLHVLLGITGAPPCGLTIAVSIAAGSFLTRQASTSLRRLTPAATSCG